MHTCQSEITCESPIYWQFLVHFFRGENLVWNLRVRLCVAAGLSHIWPKLGSNPQWWDDEQFRVLKTGVHSVMGAAIFYLRSILKWTENMPLVVPNLFLWHMHKTCFVCENLGNISKTYLLLSFPKPICSILDILLSYDVLQYLLLHNNLYFYPKISVMFC